MATTVAPQAAQPRVLSREEGRAFFDAQARTLLGISGEEFLQRWDAGEYRKIPDDRAHSKLQYLALLMPFGR